MRTVMIFSLLFITLASWAQSESKIFTSQVQLISTDHRFTEGPAWHKDGYLLFSDIPDNMIYKFQPNHPKTIWRDDSGKSNGLAFDSQGRLIACEHETRRVTRTGADGGVIVLAEHYEGKRLNSPNDCVIHSDGTIFFTDPTYGLGGKPTELGFQGVYRLMPGKEPVLLDKTFQQPNGIGLSPDEKHLYVADSQAGLVKKFELKDGALDNGKTIIETETPDGMAIDSQGRLFVTSKDGIIVLEPDGKRIETLDVLDQPANCAFGGDDHKTLFMTARTRVYQVQVSVPGLSPWN